jgi:hypothetical protein
MKSVAELRLAALIRGRDYCKENEEDLNTVAEYAPLKLLFDAAILKVEIARSINMEDITMYAVVKLQKQIYMVDLVYMYELRGAMKANSLNKPELELSLSHPRTYISHNDDASVAVKAEEIKNILKNNKAVLTNIKDEDIDLMEEAILAYNDYLSAPREAIDHRKAFGTEIITDLENEADIPKNNMGKLIHSYFPNLAEGWDQAIRVGKSTGVRHTSIIAKCTDAETGVVLGKVKATISKGDVTLVKYSSALGYIRVYSLEAGNWTMVCEDPVYNTKTLENIGVDDHHIFRTNLVFQKKS